MNEINNETDSIHYTNNDKEKFLLQLSFKLKEIKEFLFKRLLTWS